MFFMVGLANSLDELCDMIDAHRTPVMGTFDFWQEFDWKMQMHEGVKKCSKNDLFSGKTAEHRKNLKKNKLKNFGVTYLNGLDVELQKNGMYGSNE